MLVNMDFAPLFGTWEWEAQKLMCHNLFYLLFIIYIFYGQKKIFLSWWILDSLFWVVSHWLWALLTLVLFVDLKLIFAWSSCWLNYYLVFCYLKIWVVSHFSMIYFFPQDVLSALVGTWFAYYCPSFLFYLHGTENSVS